MENNNCDREAKSTERIITFVLETTNLKHDKDWLRKHQPTKEKAENVGGNYNN